QTCGRSPLLVETVKPRSGGRGLNRFAVVIQCLPREPVRLLGDVGVEPALLPHIRRHLDGGVPIFLQESGKLRPHAMTPTGVGQAHTLDAVPVLQYLESMVIEAACEPQPSIWEQCVEPESAVLARDRRLPVGASVVPLVLLAPRLQNLLDVVDDSGAVE